jgi:hypothetical protein
MGKIATLPKLDLNLKDRRITGLKQVQVVKAGRSVFLIANPTVLRLKRYNNSIQVYDPINPIGVIARDERNPPDVPFNLPHFIQKLIP